MKKWFKKWYVLIMMIRIARHHETQQRFIKKIGWDTCSEDIEGMIFRKLIEKNNVLYEKIEDGKKKVLSKNSSVDEFGLKQFKNYGTGMFDDDNYVEIFTKTPFKNIWLYRFFWY